MWILVRHHYDNFVQSLIFLRLLKDSTDLNCVDFSPVSFSIITNTRDFWKLLNFTPVDKKGHVTKVELNELKYSCFIELYGRICMINSRLPPLFSFSLLRRTSWLKVTKVKLVVYHYQAVQEVWNQFGK